MGEDHTYNSKNTGGRLNIRDRSYRTLVYSKYIGLYQVP